MSKRKDAKALARWDNEARQWATATGRDLALDLYYDRETAARPTASESCSTRREGVGRGAGQVQPRLAATPSSPASERSRPVRTWLVTSDSGRWATG